MKTLGLIGGTTWLSTIDYYRLINRLINKRLGGHHSARMYLHSIDFALFQQMGVNNDREGSVKLFSDAAKKLEQAGAECIVICANTPHQFADEIQKHIQIPIIHIVKEVAKEIQRQGMNKVALLGTGYTMEGTFYPDILSAYNIEMIVPDPDGRKFIHDSIYNELTKEIFNPETKEKYLSIIHKLISEGAQGIILGCTEIPLLIKPEECPVPTFDTTLIHAKAAVEFALGE
ncbi:MAG: aspartate/glutamate racemase family protein [Bacteroidetes bacterium]|nr:MAG: aspartate/glutamate racemase family protein [Bacteroidota bacterium]